MTGNQTTPASPEAAPPVTAPAEAATASESKRRVLIVEDNETARKQIQVFLEADPGLAVDTAANGSDALKALTERPYSVIVTDLKMPRVDGLQLLEEVQKRRLPADVHRLPCQFVCRETAVGKPCKCSLISGAGSVDDSSVAGTWTWNPYVTARAVPGASQSHDPGRVTRQGPRDH